MPLNRTEPNHGNPIPDRFRWVFDTLHLSTPSSLSRILDELPISLVCTYDRLLQEIPEGKQQSANRLLTHTRHLGSWWTGALKIRKKLYFPRVPP